jgi:transglutaminase-like putative cysteine protease
MATSIRYRITHRTAYTYNTRVSLSHSQAYLLPVDTTGQTVHGAGVDIVPPPDDRREHRDAYGNRVLFFTVGTPSDTLEVVAHSEVEVRLDAPGPAATPIDDPPWESVRDALISPTGDEAALVEFRLPSPLVDATDSVAEYASSSLVPGRALLDAATDLMHRINTDFQFDPEVTNVTTPVAEVLDHRHGVCQDFAHLTIACFRSVGLAARYVSGYIETDRAATGQEVSLVGADASHAWCEVWAGAQGWVAFDPTNDQRPHGRHVTVATGRDYGDVVPLRGVIFSGAGDQALTVEVEMSRVAD